MVDLDAGPAPPAHRASSRAGSAIRAVGVAIGGPLVLVLFTLLVFGDELAGGPIS